MEKKKTLGHVENISTDLKEPLNLKTSLDPKKIMLMVGANGTGKSFINKLVWATSTLLGMIIAKTIFSSVTGQAQFIFDNTFSDNNIDGTVKMTFTSKADIEIALEKGKVKKVDYNILDVETPTPAIYMSTDMRTFDQISAYLKTVKLLDGGTRNTKLMELYKLYDIMYVELFKTRCPITIDDRIKKSFSTFDIKEKAKKLDIDEEKNDFYLELEDGTKKYMTTYGKGHQAIINMVLGIPNP